MNENFIKYKCTVCQDLLNYPVTLKKCFHQFCLSCLQSYIKSNLKSGKQLECPLCRAKFQKNDYVFAVDLQREIENSKIHCKCGELIPIQKFEEHKEKCKINFENKDGVSLGIYNCTLCPKQNMNREEYVNHIKESHSKDVGVCAICSVQPWGDKNYQTFLLGHVDLRHKKEMIKFYQNPKEIELLKKVLEQSKYEK